MNGSQRPLKDRVWAEWTFTAENDVDEDRACHIFFEEELRFVLQDQLAAAVADMPAGDALDATLQAQKVAVDTGAQITRSFPITRYECSDTRLGRQLRE